jgi:hypothetical protein
MSSRITSPEVMPLSWKPGPLDPRTGIAKEILDPWF